MLNNDQNGISDKMKKKKREREIVVIQILVRFFTILMIALQKELDTRGHITSDVWDETWNSLKQ